MSVILLKRKPLGKIHVFQGMSGTQNPAILAAIRNLFLAKTKKHTKMPETSFFGNPIEE